MLRIIAEKEEITAASLVAHSVELTDVTLSKAGVSGSVYLHNKFDVKIHLKLSDPTTRFELGPTGSDVMFVFTEMKVEGYNVDQENKGGIKQPVFLIQAEFVAEFGIPSGEMPASIREKGLPAFTRLNGPYICMPYLREFIDGLARQMRLTLPPLPTVVIEEKMDDPVPEKQ